MRGKLVEQRPGMYTLPKEGDMLVPGRVFSSEVLLDALQDDSLDQVANAASLPGVCGCSIAMPDMHVGYGFCVGGVSAFDAKDGIVSPGAIGFDINCGVRLLATSLTVSDLGGNVDVLLDVLSRHVGVGVGGKGSYSLSHKQLKEVFLKGASWAVENGYGISDDVECCEERGCFSDARPELLSQRAMGRGMNQLGTIGAGNHFLEVQRVSEIVNPSVAKAFGLSEDQVVVMIHCGSRGVGHQVCTDTLKELASEYPDLLDSLPEKNLAYAPLSSPLAKKYLGAMRAAANFAFCNRQMLTHAVRKSFARLFSNSSVSVVYDVSHNIAKFEDHIVDGSLKSVLVHRKGATRAFPAGHPDVCERYSSVGHPVLIPGSMGTSSWVLVGTDGAMKYSFGSSAHGAGRVLSRTDAKKRFDGVSVRSALAKKNIVVKAESTLGIAEEAPGVYKDVDEVVSVTEVAQIASRVARLSPLGVLKG